MNFDQLPDNRSGYQNFGFFGWLELGGCDAKGIEEPMHIFADEVMPASARERAGKVLCGRAGSP